MVKIYLIFSFQRHRKGAIRNNAPQASIQPPRTGTWRMNREKIQELKDDGIRAVPSEMIGLIGKTLIRDI